MHAEDLVRSGGAADLPSVILHGPSEPALLAMASQLAVASSSRSAPAVDSVAERLFGAELQGEFALPAGCPWGGGTRVVVSLAHAAAGSGCDASRIRVPAADEAGSGGAHLARCAGVLEACKEASGSWCISMRRKTVVVHLVCRLPRPVQIALAKVIEASADRALFVLTCLRLSAMPARLLSIALCARVPHPDGPAGAETLPPQPPRPNVAAWARAVAGGRATPRQVAALAAREGGGGAQDLPAVVSACAAAEHLAARLRSLGVSGDSVDCRRAMAERIAAAGAPPGKDGLSPAPRPV